MLAPGLSAAVPWLVPEQPANSDSNSDSSRDANRDANQAVADELRAHGERLDRMTGQLEATSDRLGRIESEQAGIVERLQTLEQAVTEAIEQGDERAAETRQSTDSLSTAVAELQVQMQEVWQREGEQREIDREIQRRLLLMEAASLLAFGQARAALGSDVEAALEAYRQADALVRRADDPSLGQIRRLLAEELDALADMSVPDWVQLQGMIQRQAARVAEWPVVQPGPTDRTPDSAAEPDGWIEATRDALGGLVRVIDYFLDEPLEVGDRVETSSRGGLFPRGILVGDIIRVEAPDPNSLRQEFLVRPAVEVQNLLEVALIDPI